MSQPSSVLDREDTPCRAKVVLEPDPACWNRVQARYEAPTPTASHQQPPQTTVPHAIRGRFRSSNAGTGLAPYPGEERERETSHRQETCFPQVTPRLPTLRSSPRLSAHRSPPHKNESAQVGTGANACAATSGDEEQQVPGRRRPHLRLHGWSCDPANGAFGRSHGQSRGSVERADGRGGRLSLSHASRHEDLPRPQRTLRGSPHRERSIGPVRTGGEKARRSQLSCRQRIHEQTPTFTEGQEV